jgi:integrase
VGEQHQPVFTSEQVTEIVARSKGQDRMLFALLAGTGMRAGEAFGLTIENIFADCSTITIKQSVWGGQVQSPKTKNALREIDLSPSLAAMLRSHIGDRKAGFLFQNRAGKFLCQTNTLRRSLHPVLKDIGAAMAGFHAFRRFRVTQLRRTHTPGDLIHFGSATQNRR